MSVFVDTNVLVRTVDPADPKHEISARTISALIEAGESLYITPQIAAEFWNVATRQPRTTASG
jgi:predicted nucleic acid-binding protein